MVKRLLTLLSLLVLINISLLSQISEGGLPPSFKYKEVKSFNTQNTNYVKANRAHINRLLREDAFDESQTKPLPIATAIPVSYNLLEDGKWTVLQNGTRICQLNIVAPDALGIILEYSSFYIPKGNKLFIYNKDKTQVLGAYTNSTNPFGGSFSTEIVYGEELTLEYVEYCDEEAHINISSVGYGYQGILNYTKTADPLVGFNDAGYCQVNVNCPEGNEWQTEKKSVARIYAKIGSDWYRSTGSLINNTKNDKTPLLLTAAHCIRDNGIVATMSNIQFYFNYEFSGCAKESNAAEGYQTMVGAEILVLTPLYGGSDGALLLLNENIPDNYDVYFNGWDITEAPSKSGAIIHHPQGDVKKISTYEIPLETKLYYDIEGYAMQNAHWAVQYAKTQSGYGTTEKGSSGSPIFSKEKLVVGTLTGGYASCYRPEKNDYYGKISYHWDKNTNESDHMKPFLDPIGANVRKMTGLANIGGQPIDPPSIAPDELAPEAYAFWTEDNSRSQLTVVVKDSKDYIKKISFLSLGGYNIYRNSDINHNTLSIEISNWPNGLYIVYIETISGKKHNFKVVK